MTNEQHDLIEEMSAVDKKLAEIETAPEGFTVRFPLMLAYVDRQGHLCDSGYCTLFLRRNGGPEEQTCLIMFPHMNEDSDKDSPQILTTMLHGSADCTTLALAGSKTFAEANQDEIGGSVSFMLQLPHMVVWPNAMPEEMSSVNLLLSQIAMTVSSLTEQNALSGKRFIETSLDVQEM